LASFTKSGKSSIQTQESPSDFANPLPWFCIFRPDGSLIDVNRSMRLACHIPNPIVGNNFYSVLAVENPQELQAQLTQLSLDDEEMELQIPAHLPNAYPINWSFRGQFSAEGRLQEIIGIGEPQPPGDLSTSLIKELIHNDPNAAVLLDADGRVLVINQMAATLINKPSEVIVGEKLIDLYPGGLNNQRLSEALSEVSKGKKIIYTVHAQGKWLENSILPVLDETGKITHFAFYSQEVDQKFGSQDELWDSQTRLELAAQGLQDGLWDWFDVSRDEEWWSPRLFELLGYRQGDFEPSFSGFMEMVHPQDRMRLQAALQEHREHLAPYDVSLRVMHKSGDYRWFRSRGRSIRDHNGMPVRMAGSMQDITSEVEAIEELGRRNDEIRMLYESARHLAESLRLEDIYLSLVAILKKKMSCDSLVVSSYDASTKLIRCEYILHEDKEIDVKEFPLIPLEPEGKGTQSRVIHSREPLLIDDYLTFVKQATHYYFDQEGLVEEQEEETEDEVFMQSALIVPILLKNQVIGVIQVFSMNQKAYSNDDLKFLENISSQIGIAVTNASLYERAQKEIENRQSAENALRASEEKFRGVIEQSTDGVVITEADGKLIVWNAAQEIITGISAGEAVGFTIWDLMNDYSVLQPDQLATEELRLILHRFLNEGEKPQDSVTFEHDFTRRDGTTRRLQTSIFSIDSSEGEYRLALLSRDITQISRRHQELEVIARVNKSLRRVMTMQEVLSVVMEEATDLLEAMGTSVVLYEPETNILKVSMATGAWKQNSGIVITDEQSISMQVIASSQPFLSSNLQSYENERLTSIFSFENMASAACFPLVADEKVGGVLWVGCAYEFDEMDLRILELISDIAASAVDRAKMTEARLKQIQRMTALRKIDRAISTGFDRNLNLEIFLRETQKQLDCDAAIILLYNPYMQHLEISQAVGIDPNRFRGGYVRVGIGEAGRVVFERKTIIINNLETQPVHYSFLSQKDRSLSEEYHYKAYIAVPLMAKGQIKGVLELYFNNPVEPAADWLDFLEMMAGQAAIMIDNAELFIDLQKSNLDLQMAYQSTLEGWVKAIDMRDKETEGHTQRVT
jgi:PAS domain S-box-containing protein